MNSAKFIEENLYCDNVIQWRMLLNKVNEEVGEKGIADSHEFCYLYNEKAFNRH